MDNNNFSEQVNVNQPEAISSKSYLTLVLLSFFLSGLGADRFYLGKIGTAILKIIFGPLTFGIWNLIDFIIAILGKARDSEGLLVSR